MFTGLTLATMLIVPAAQEGSARDTGDRQIVVFRVPQEGSDRAAMRERRLQAAERLLDRASAELNADQPGRALAMIRAARILMRQGPVGAALSEEGPGRDRGRRVEVRAEARSEGDPKERGNVRVEIRTRIRKDDGTEEEKVEVREFPLGSGGILRLDGGNARVESAEAAHGEEAESHEPEGEETEAAPAGERELPVGVGLLLEIEDGSYVVRGVLPGSPAAEDGSIKEGDRVVGVMSDDESSRDFDGKSLEEVVRLIRGEAGSRVRLIVKSSESDETREVELERRPLKPPASGDE